MSTSDHHWSDELTKPYIPSKMQSRTTKISKHPMLTPNPPSTSDIALPVLIRTESTSIPTAPVVRPSRCGDGCLGLLERNGSSLGFRLRVEHVRLLVSDGDGGYSSRRFRDFDRSSSDVSSYEFASVSSYADAVSDATHHQSLSRL